MMEIASFSGSLEPAVNRAFHPAPADANPLAFIAGTTSAGIVLKISSNASNDRIDANDKTFTSNYYMFSGYPKSRSHLFSPRDHKMKAKAFSFTGQARSSKAIREIGFEPETHIVVDFNRNEMLDETGKIVTAPDPDGISGGAVWYGEGDRLNWPTGEGLHLVGIGIANPAKNSVLIGTRIHFVLEGIRAKNPDLNEFLPKRNGVSINVTVI